MRCHPEVLRSASNTRIRALRAVAQGKDRSLILLEGSRLVGDALSARCQVEAIFVREDRQDLLLTLPQAQVPCFAVAPALHDRLSTLKQAPPVLALAAPPAPARIGDLPTSNAPLVLVVAGIADPGNLGALARSAEAAGARLLVHVGGGVSTGNPKALRGSMGSLLRLPVAPVADAQDAWQELDRLGYRQLGAATRGGKTPARTDWSGPCALWITGETGVAPAVMDRLIPITIPLAAPVESSTPRSPHRCCSLPPAVPGGKV
ncbi:MAG: RNA methyltransferase [Planctomycetota bacterium]